MEDSKSIALLDVIPIYHYDFVNQQGRSIKTTKFIASFSNHQFANIDGTSELLNDQILYHKINCNAQFDGKKWVLLKIVK